MPENNEDITTERQKLFVEPNSNIEYLLTKGIEERDTMVVIETDEITTPEFGTVKLRGMFPCFLPPEDYLELDHKRIEAMTEDVIQFIANNGALPGGTIEFEKFTNNIRDTAQTMYILLGTYGSLELYESEQLRLSITLTGLFFNFDDAVDTTCAFIDFKEDRLAQLLRMFRQLTLEDNPEEHILECGMLPSLTPILQCIIATLKRLRAISVLSPEKEERLKKLWFNSILGTALKQMERERGEPYPDLLDHAIEVQDKYGEISSESTFLLFGIEVPEDICENFLFYECKRQYTATIAATNDMLSLAKELKHDIYDSPIARKALAKKWTLEESFRQKEREAKESAEAFFAICRLLRNIYPDSEQLDNILIVYCIGMDTAGHFNQYWKRYSDTKFSTIKCPSKIET